MHHPMQRSLEARLWLERLLGARPAMARAVGSQRLARTSYRPSSSRGGIRSHASPLRGSPLPPTTAQRGPPAAPPGSSAIAW